jgi:tetratricopeptide (TPR) repeat protein
MKGRISTGILIVTALLLASGVAALGVRRARQSGTVPSLNQVRALARAKQFGAARSLLLGYFRTHPDDAQAHLLMAHLATEPDDPVPDVALGHLRAIRPDSRPQAAVLKFVEGKAQYQRKRYDLAEACWNDALSLDPTVPEAGWALLDLLDLEGRVDLAHRLGMRLYEVEPDVRDRVRLLLEMARLDIDKVAPGSQIPIFEPLAREHPENLPLALTLGLAFVHDSQGERGVQVLADALRRHTDSPEAWDAWFTGLYDAYQFDKLAGEFARLPKALAALPRFAKHEGMIAENARNWPAAIRAYRRAFAAEPYNGTIGYRLRQSLWIAGDRAEAERVDHAYSAFEDAFKKMRGAYNEARSDKSLGLLPHVELYHRLAVLREKMGRPDEARAWHRLVLRDAPNNPASLAALERLK